MYTVTIIDNTSCRMVEEAERRHSEAERLRQEVLHAREAEKEAKNKLIGMSLKNSLLVCHFERGDLLSAGLTSGIKTYQLTQ